MVGFKTRWDAPSRRLAIAFSCCLMLVSYACLAQPRVQSVAEPKIRAAVIVKILQFTSWEKRELPDEVTVCVIGEPVSQNELLKFDPPKKMGKKTIKVERVSSKSLKGENTREQHGCDITVLGEKFTKNAYKSLAEKFETQGILTICDGCDRSFAKDSMIDLVLVDQRLNFNVNLGHAKSANIRLDSSMLELASEVRQ